MLLHKIVLTFLISIVCSSNLDPKDIIINSIKRLNQIDMKFLANIKQQSSISDPINYNLNFVSYWSKLDPNLFYNYVKFNSPIDYKDIEIWLKYDNKSTISKKRLPINNKITIIENDYDNSNLIELFNFFNLFKDLDDKNLILKEKEINQKKVHYIKASDKKNKKKSIKIYIDKDNYCIYKIEWTDRRGRVSKKIVFDGWKVVDKIYFSTEIIYEDFKNQTKVTSILSEINFNNLNNYDLDRIALGFNFDK